MPVKGNITPENAPSLSAMPAPELTPEPSSGNDMTPERLLKLINEAREREQRTHAFRRLLEERARALHLIIRIDGDDPVASLTRFAEQYIETAPRLIECVEACARAAGNAELFAPFIRAATGYFQAPSVLLSRYTGLDGLLIQAYLCHRLIEEMYENNRSLRNSDLVDIEPTQANILAHHLIGEPFANELDDAILITVRQIAGTPDYYDIDFNTVVTQARHDAWNWMREYWQTLLSRNGIYFQFSYRQAI